LWLVDLERATSLRLTSTHGSSLTGSWSPDGRRIAFSSNRTGVDELYEKDASGVSGEELLVKSAHTKFPTGWSPEGRFLVYLDVDPKTKGDIWVLPIEGERKPFWGKLSPLPDGQGHLWMAYSSDETGRDEIYLRPFLPSGPDEPAGSKVRVSTGGGFHPRWSRNGRELFYFADNNKLMAVDVKLGMTRSLELPRCYLRIIL
jgi:Tol biopolymer transport system component